MHAALQQKSAHADLVGFSTFFLNELLYESFYVPPHCIASRNLKLTPDLVSAASMASGVLSAAARSSGAAPWARAAFHNSISKHK